MSIGDTVTTLQFPNIIRQIVEARELYFIGKRKHVGVEVMSLAIKYRRKVISLFTLWSLKATLCGNVYSSINRFELLYIYIYIFLTSLIALGNVINFV